ncbi:hypothetical protein Moror_15210 [Moniliophthora roreri MCA 2997]|uniref:NADAR domain-containing protein n=3 Tax=Moniliophthora roreri TaxID=221103 RepID=V2X2Q4_MONRO|nr:hypothetical protein Moror_15210 [Moniliophthora roreri MCA 2997]KAI3609211.1 hypothetical protein WG66_010642 [Moniliophthora roreri]
MNYRTAITITTTPANPIPPDPLSPTSPKQPRFQLVEERRTYYVTSDIPVSQWEHRDIANVLKLPEIPESDKVTGSPFHRSKSQNEIQMSTALSPPTSPSPPRPRSVQDMPISPPSTSRYQSRRHSRPLALHAITNTRTPPNSPSVPPRQKILFYHKHDPHYGFTNFSAHPVFYKGKRYPTSEHLFQSFKFEHKPALAEHIRTISERPSDAFSEARRLQHEVRPDWRAVNIEKMDVALYHKFTQHHDLKQELLATGDAELVEDSDKDAFWGIGQDRRGRNELGKALERLRSQLRGF